MTPKERICCARPRGESASTGVCDVVLSREQMEFPMSALVTEEFAMGPSGEHQDAAQYVQGGALKTWIQLPEDPDAFSISESSH